MPRFTCPSCQTLLDSGSLPPGTAITCPRCKGTLRLPAPARSAPPPLSPAATSPPPGARPGRWWVVAGVSGAGLAVAAVAVLIAFPPGPGQRDDPTGPSVPVAPAGQPQADQQARGPERRPERPAVEEPKRRPESPTEEPKRRPDSPAPEDPKLPAGHTVLGPDDLTYLGGFRVPDYAGPASDNNSTAWTTGGLTHRYHDGKLRFFSTTHAYSGGLVYEMNFPGLGTEKEGYPQASLVKAWGDVYDGHKWTGNEHSGKLGAGVYTYGLYYDPERKRLYWNYGHWYNTDHTDNPCFGYSVLDDEKGAATGMGCWRLEGRSEKFGRGGCLRIPEAFAKAYCGGKSLGVGFGGYFSIVSSASFGPALCAVADPVELSPRETPEFLLQKKYGLMSDGSYNLNSRGRKEKWVYASRVASGWCFLLPNGELHAWDGVQTGPADGPLLASLTAAHYADPAKLYGTAVTDPPSLSAVANVPLVGYPADCGDRCHRPANYRSTYDNGNWNPRGDPPIGYWTWSDEIWGGAAWIDLPARQGLLLFATVGTGNVYYEKSERYAKGTEMLALVYDPADLAAVAQGKKKQWQIQPARSWKVKIPALPDPLPGGGGSPLYMVGGATFDVKTKTLYLLVTNVTPVGFERKPMIFAYKVKG